MDQVDAALAKLPSIEGLLEGYRAGRVSAEEIIAQNEAEKKFFAQFRAPVRQMEIEQARRDPNAMIEMVMVDKETRKPFKQLRAHRDIQSLLQKTFEAGLQHRDPDKADHENLNNLLLELPFRTGKTQQLVGFILWLLGQDQTLTGAYIREAHKDAKGIVGQMAMTIHLNEVYKEIFPKVKLQSQCIRGLGGAKEDFTLVRDPKLAISDPTVQAVGMNEVPEGKRWDWFAGDDIETDKTASSDALRERNKSVFRGPFKSRLGKVGFYIVIGQERHDSGVMAWIKEKEKHKHIRIKLMEDINDYETCNFPEMFSWEEIQNLQRDMTSFMIYRQLEREDPKEKERRRIAVEACKGRAYENLDQYRFYHSYPKEPTDIIAVAMDLNYDDKPTSHFTAATALKYNPERYDRQVLTVRKERLDIGFDTVDFAIQMYLDFNPDIFVVESVGAQKYLLNEFHHPEKGYIQTHPALGRMNLIGYVTTKWRKQNARYGFPGLFTFMRNRKMIFPITDNEEDERTMDAFYKGIMAYQPDKHAADDFIALLFADHGITVLLQERGLPDLARINMDSVKGNVVRGDFKRGDGSNNDGANWKPDIISIERARKKEVAESSSGVVSLVGYAGKRW